MPIMGSPPMPLSVRILGSITVGVMNLHETLGWEVDSRALASGSFRFLFNPVSDLPGNTEEALAHRP